MDLILAILFVVICFGCLFDKPKKKKSKSFGEGLLTDTKDNNLDIHKNF